jgi:transcriptional regulator with XRE-family HTH domain
LAAILRRLRSDSGRTIEDVAAHLECSAAKVSRIENGLVGVRIQDARELLDLYGVHGERREEILELVRQARGRGWWLPYADVMSEGFERVLGFEDEATVMLLLETRLIPGLLQTENYATALFAATPDFSGEAQERRLHLRMERQKLLERAQPPVLDVLLDEAALRRRVGTAQVMAEQCGHLIGLAGRPNISLRVLPLDGETHQAAGFAFTIFGFADPGDPKVVYEELYKSTVWQESAESVGRYTAAFDQARGCALGEAESLAFLADLARRPG